MLSLVDSVTSGSLHGQSSSKLGDDDGIQNALTAEMHLSQGRVVIMLADVMLGGMIKAGKTPERRQTPVIANETHWTLLRNLHVDRGANQVELKLYTWGASYRQVRMKLDVFLSYYCGFVSGKP